VTAGAPERLADSLHEALRWWQRLRPEEPALVFHRAWRWDWWSWRRLHRQVASYRPRLDSLAAEAIAFRYRPSPRHLALDLAIQAAGMTAAPLGIGERELPPELLGRVATTACARFADEEGFGGGAVPCATLPMEEPAAETAAGLGTGAWAGASLEQWAGSAAGRVLALAVDASEACWIEQEVLRRAAEGIQRQLASEPGREIALVSGPLRVLPERLWLAWGLHYRACLVLAPEPEATAAALYWARPTVACLPAAWLPGVRSFLERQERRRALRRRLRRLRILLAWGEVAGGEEQQWRRLGPWLTPFPAVMPGCGNPPPDRHRNGLE
jgi:hypothetical protein